MKERLKQYYLDLVKDERKGALAALFCFLLLLSSFVYGFLVKLVLSCYQGGPCKSFKPNCKVISVGNITWGGTGKTALTESLVRYFKQIRRNPAILMRGYGSDEVYMLKDKFKDIPVLAGRNRISTSAVALERYAADTIILDDGFQHWRLGRDVDVVLIDASSPFGNGRLIPRGILREPLSSLERADVFVLTKLDSEDKEIESIKQVIRRYNQRAPIFEAGYQPRYLRNLISGEKIEPSAIKNEQIAVLCGIANPESFAKTLNSLGAKVCLKLYFSDHFQYRKQDLTSIERQCLNNQINTVLTTEKDAPKLKELLKSCRLSLRVLALGAELKIIKDQQRFFHFLLSGKDTNRPYSILVLNDGRAGHLNQAKATANLVQKKRVDSRLDSRVDKRIVKVEFRNALFRLLLSVCSVFSSPQCRRCMRCLRICLKKESFEELLQVRADMVISCGASLSSVNLFLAYKNRARKIILMKPSFLSLDRFDLAIVPEHDRVKVKGNVLVTKITPNLIDRQYLEEQAGILRNRLRGIRSSEALEAGRLRIGVLIGGDTTKFRMSRQLMERVVSQLKMATEQFDGQILITTSRRTPSTVEQLLKRSLANFSKCKLLVIANEKNFPETIGGILGLSDIIVVSGESISMVSEALSAEKYVLVFAPEKRTKKQTRQEKFLKRLEEEEVIKVVGPNRLFEQIEKIWKEKPKLKKISDKELIYQAIGKLFFA